MKTSACVLAALASATAFMGTPMQARTVSRSSLSMANVVDTVADLQGPQLYWGSAGAAIGKKENEIKGYDNFKVFTKALKDTGVAEQLKKGGPYTVFAPTDNAFADYKGPVNAELVKNHIHEGKLTLDNIQGDVKTMQGTLKYGRRFRKTFLDEAIVGIISAGASCSQTYPTDVSADNGVIHGINCVLEL